MLFVYGATLCYNKRRWRSEFCISMWEVARMSPRFQLFHDFKPAVNMRVSCLCVFVFFDTYG